MGAPLAQLPDAALRVISAEKDLPEVPPELRERLANRLLDSTSSAGADARSRSPGIKAAALVAVGAEASSEGLGTAAGVAVQGVSAWAFGTKLAAAGLLSFTLGSGAGAAVHALATREPSPPSIPTLLVVESSAPVAVRTSASQRASVEVPVPTASAVVSSIEAPSVSARAPAASADPLRRERSLLDTARMAVLRGDRKAAKDALGQHAREFPNGQHAADRHALEARANALPE